MTFDPKTPVRNRYDSDVPANLLEFMLKSWKPPSRRQPVGLKDAASFRKRRDRLSQRFPGELLVIPTGHFKVRANDTNYPFRPGTDFYYLTGAWEPDCVLVLRPEDNSHEQLLFVEPNPGKSDATFFTDRVKGELWEGYRPGVSESSAQYAIPCRSLEELEPFLHSILSMPNTRVRVLRGLPPPPKGLSLGMTQIS